MEHILSEIVLNRSIWNIKSFSLVGENIFHNKWNDI